MSARTFLAGPGGPLSASSNPASLYYLDDFHIYISKSNNASESKISIANIWLIISAWTANRKVKINMYKTEPLNLPHAPAKTVSVFVTVSLCYLIASPSFHFLRQKSLQVILHPYLFYFHDPPLNQKKILLAVFSKYFQIQLPLFSPTTTNLVQLPSPIMYWISLLTPPCTPSLFLSILFSI